MVQKAVRKLTPENKSRTMKNPEIKECFDYIDTISKTDCYLIKDVTELLENLSYVFLTRKQRIVLVFKVFKTLFRGVLS
jgi:hypothetical protein